MSIRISDNRGNVVTITSSSSSSVESEGCAALLASAIGLGLLAGGVFFCAEQGWIHHTDAEIIISYAWRSVVTFFALGMVLAGIFGLFHAIKEAELMPFLLCLPGMFILGGIAFWLSTEIVGLDYLPLCTGIVIGMLALCRYFKTLPGTLMGTVLACLFFIYGWEVSAAGLAIIIIARVIYKQYHDIW